MDLEKNGNSCKVKIGERKKLNGFGKKWKGIEKN